MQNLIKVLFVSFIIFISIYSCSASSEFIEIKQIPISLSPKGDVTDQNIVFFLETRRSWNFN